MTLHSRTSKPLPGAPSLRRALLIADPGDGMRWLGWSRGWADEAAASDAVERLETLSVSRQIADVAGFLGSDDGTWLIARGGLMPEEDPGHRYWREAVRVERADLERIRANPFRLMPGGPPPSPEQPHGVELPPLAPPDVATADTDIARVRELRTRPWGRASWNIETLLAAALDVEHTLITGSAVSMAALELLILLLPPSLRPELTFHTYALAEPRRPVPRLTFTQFEDDWLFPETAAFGHRLPATELRITKRARNAAAELLGLLDTPDRLAQAHAAYESLSTHVSSSDRVLLREVETVLSLARMLAVREHGHPGAGIRVLEQELARIGPTDWLAPDAMKPEQVRIDVLTNLLLDAFPARPLGAAVVDAIQSGHEPTALLLLMRRFLARHQPGSAEADRFADAFSRLPSAAWPSATRDETRELRELIARVAPEQETPSQLPDDWTEAAPARDVPSAPVADVPSAIVHDGARNGAGTTSPFSSPDAVPPVFADASDAIEAEPVETSPETEVLRSVVAGLAIEAANARATDSTDSRTATAPDEASSQSIAARQNVPISAPIKPEHARFARPAADVTKAPIAASAAPPEPASRQPVAAEAADTADAAPPKAPPIVGPVLMPADDVANKPLGKRRRAAAFAATIGGILVLGLGTRALFFNSPASDGRIAAAGSTQEVTPPPETESVPAIAFAERIAAARGFAADRDWAGVREAVGVAFASLTTAESFARDSLLARASLQLARAMRQNESERIQLFTSVFEHTNRALASVAPFAPGTEELRLMQAEACLEGSLDCDSGEVVENLVLAVRSPSAEISGRANELLSRTSPVSHETAVLVSNDGGAGRL